MSRSLSVSGKDGNMANRNINNDVEDANFDRDHAGLQEIMHGNAQL